MSVYCPDFRGYQKTEDGYLINPVEGEIIHRIFSALLEGKGADRIARELNEANIPTRSTMDGAGETLWSGNTIRFIVKNPFYVGDSLYTGNNGDTALNNVKYFASGNTRSAGVHFFVSQNGDVQ